MRYSIIGFRPLSNVDEMTSHGTAASGRAAALRAAAGFASPIIAFVILSTYFCLFGPRVPVAGGLGWDGVHYGRCAIDLDMCLREDSLSTYTIHRLLPSVVVGAVATATGTHLNARSVTCGLAS